MLLLFWRQDLRANLATTKTLPLPNQTSSDMEQVWELWPFLVARYRFGNLPSSPFVAFYYDSHPLKLSAFVQSNKDCPSDGSSLFFEIW